MSFTGYRWGATRGFTLDDGGYMRVAAHVKEGNVIDKLELIHVDGGAHEATAKLAKLSEKWVGENEREWARAA